MSWRISKTALEGKLLSQGLQRYNRGDGAENFLRSIIQRGSDQYDVFKVSVDYGIDLIALERKSLTEEQQNFYYFQVKSCHVTPQCPDGQRAFYPFAVEVASTTLNLMGDRQNFAIVIFLYNEERPDSYTDKGKLPFMYFWLSGKDLVELAERLGGLKKSKDQFPLGPYYQIAGKVIMPREDAENQSPYVVITGEEGRLWYGGKNGANEAGEVNRFKIDRFFRHQRGGEPNE